MKTPEHIATKRQKMIEHLEAALALADETKDGTAGYMIERALDILRATVLPGNLDVPPPS
jgi:uncharacterized phage-like protein YoqJ